MTAWSASPTMSVGLAPNRSAIRPQAIRPAMDERPETPSTVAASIAATPWSIAWVTMWKIGPACAAQQAKCERDRPELRCAQHLDRGEVALGRGRAAPRDGAHLGRSVTDQERDRDRHKPGQVAERDHRHPPVVGGREPADEG